MESSGIDTKMVDGPEESSWTFYIQGFICDNNMDEEDDHSSFSSQPESPSLVSDAASSAVKKLADGLSIGLSKQNAFKKKKTKVTIVDFDLEDTASSPVNSPKQVSYMNHFMNQKEKAKMDVPEVKRNSFGKAGAFAVQKDTITNYADLQEKKTFY